jgi:uncharacterized iron-regulated membrane protein
MNKQNTATNSLATAQTYIRRRMYGWHRTIGTIVCIPVIFWTLSGLMHPFMAHWFKPEIARQFVIPKPVDQAQISLSLQEVLTQNSIATLQNFRIVSFAGQTYYQVKQKAGEPLRYFDTQSGQELPDGEQKHAEHLARYFLDDAQSPLKSITLQTEFDGQYKFVNRLLPVWKLSFDRPDRMDVYVETSSDRLATFNPTSRKAFLWVFDNFHNWSFLEAIANNWLRITVMIAFLSIIILAAVSGLVIYGFMWSKFKAPANGDKTGFLRRYHRQIGLATALVTLTFAFSGAYHATRKYSPNRLPEMVYTPEIKTADLRMASTALPLDWERLHDLSLIQIRKTPYFQAFYKATEDQPAETQYYQALNGTVLENGNQVYAEYLVQYFMAKLNTANAADIDCCEMSQSLKGSDFANASLLETKPIAAFDNREYGFIFKRLPVVKFAYDTPDSDTFFVETSSGHLAAHIRNADRREGLSFAIFHKFFLMDWAGKNVRDGVMMLSALGVLVVNLMGMVLWWGKPKRKR